MARKHNTALDLSLNEILNVRLQNLSSDPANLESQIYYNTTSHAVKFYNGTAWQTLSTSAGYTTENAQDDIAAAFAAGTHSFLTITYDDANNKFSFAVTDSPLLNGQNAAYYLSRANHTGTQLAATISDFNTAVRLNRIDQLAAAGADVSFGGFKATSLGTGTAASDAVNLGQVQDLINTGTNKSAVRVASTADVTIASALVNGASLDGVTLATGDRVLLKNQSTSAQNGIYIVAASGAASRATDADISAEFKGGLSVWVNEGTANGDTRWVLTTNDPITLGTTTPITFVQDFKATSTTAGAGLVVSGAALAVGAGTGITVNADDVAIDTSVVARKATGTLTGGATSEVITHNLNTRGVVVSIYLSAGTFAEEDFEVEHTSVNTVTVRYSPGNIPSSTYSWVCIG